jgi:3-deoxy-manno-octulosonate cytidylyltransferase (CMP-KDO synthetase)
MPISIIQGIYSSFGLKADHPSAENRRPLETIGGGLGSLPIFVSETGDSVLASFGRPDGIVPLDLSGHRTNLVGPSPARSGRVGSCVRTPFPFRANMVRFDPAKEPAHSVLCLIMRLPRVRAFHHRCCSSASLDQCLFYRTVSREIFFRNMEIVGVIPARFASTRLPGKALLSETGRPLILHVVDAARRSRSLQRIIVATDDDRIARTVADFGAEVMMTRADHATGTDRVAEVAGQLDQARIIVNLQGDEPEISGETLDLVVALLENDREAPMATLATPIRDESIYHDQACVKVVRDRRGRALYFSRSPIPCHRDGLPDPAAAHTPVAHLHLGLYAYRRDFLLQLGSLAPSPLEDAEKLEQLRVLEAGYPIAVGIVDEPSVGIDTPEDYRRFVARWRAREAPAT